MKNVKKVLLYPIRWLKTKSKEVRLLWIGLILIAIGSFGAALLQTDFGRIEVTEIVIPTENGQWVAADLYRPKTATADNKAPAIVVIPGFNRSRETQTNMSLELARRGFVTIVIDLYAQGDSSSSMSSQSATTEGYGAMALIDYIHNTDNFNYIDKSRVGATGHSAGGNAALRSAQRFGIEVIDGLRPESKLAAIYVSGYVLSFTDGALSTVRSNIGADYARWDEGAFRNDMRDNPDIHDADMRFAPEAIRLVNSGLIQNGEPPITEVEMNRIYGNPNNNTMRIFHNVRVLHSFQPFSAVSTAYMIEFFEFVFEHESDMSPYNQTYMVKEVFTGFSLVGGFLFVFGLGGVLLKTPYFSSLVNPLPKRITQNTFDKRLFWVLFVISALIACFIYAPMARLSISWFRDAHNAIQTAWFPARMINAVMMWAVFNGVVGILLFFGVYFLRGRKNGADLSPLKLKPYDVFKTILLALIVFMSFYGIVNLLHMFFHVDFRFTLIAARVLKNTNMIIYSFFLYIPFFFIFYLSNSIRVNMSMRVDRWSEFKSTLIGCLGNSVGLMLILVVQYAAFISTGKVFWLDEWLYINMIFGLIPLMFILPIFNRYFFNRTGKVYLGALIACMLFIVMAITSSVAYIPL